MNADNLRAVVRDHFKLRAERFELDSRIAVHYVLNWGGFVNFSYRVSDGRREYHLKLSTTADGRSALRRWMHLSPLLERHHAPPIIEWMDVGVAAGLLFPCLPGSPPKLDDEVAVELMQACRSLHADHGLAAALRSSGTVTARDAYMASFHERFMEDLRGIHDSRPPFVSEDLFHWLEYEVSAHEGRISASTAFDEPLTKPIHGDLWLDNVLWTDRSRWYLVDWDDLRIGDPAADLAAAFGPTADDVRPLKMLESASSALTREELERLPHLGRATLLDWIIDPLSDWIDAGTAPEHAVVVRAEKERIHRQALALYRDLYP